MSRKKIKKELVKRNISMYDPMGIYGRGLTKNQKEGMTRRMKVEYMSPPPVRVDQHLLEEYKKTLIHYSIPTVIRYRDTTVSILMNPVGENLSSETINSTKVIQYLRGIGINPVSIRICSFILKRSGSVWPSVIKYNFYYGDGNKEVVCGDRGSALQANSETCIIPGYWKDGTVITYAALTLDSQKNDLYETMTDEVIPDVWTSLINYDIEQTPIPFIRYPVGPDNVDPYLIISCNRPVGTEGPVMEVILNLNIAF